MKFARRKREEVSVNLTPLIDVVFLLLIFFMVSTTFTKETRLSLDLPEASGEPPANQANMLEVTVSASGEYGINGKPLLKNDIQTLINGIRKVTDGKTNLPMVITADGKAPHQSVVTVMDVAGRLGFVNLSITAQQPSSE